MESGQNPLFLVKCYRNFFFDRNEQVMNDSRQLAYHILNKVIYSDGFSNILINKGLKNSKFNNQDRGFVTELVYGTLEKKMYLTHIIQKFSKTPVEKLSKQVVLVLMMGLYQIYYMNSVTDFAAVDESVKLCKKVFPKGSGFVNGVLRNILRDPKAKEVHEKDKIKRWSIQYSMEDELIKLFIQQYGEPKTENILVALEEKPSLYLRVNTLKNSPQELMGCFSDEVELERVLGEKLALKIKNFKRIGEHDCYKNGGFTIQDISSMKAVRALDPKAGEVVLDMCACPGGKTTFMGELMNNQGKIVAKDISGSKLRLVEEACKRLGITIVEVGQMDGTQFCEQLKAQFHRVLIDAPCSGLGIIRKKPELRYKKLKDIQPLYDIQQRILTNGAQYVKPGGRLVYSTCTINQLENEDQINRFLKNGSFDLISEERVLFEEGASDGFYIATLQKRENDEKRP